jgi:hypothetical protein
VGEYKDFDKEYAYQMPDSAILNKTNVLADLKQYALNNVKIDGRKLKEKIEAVDIDSFRSLGTQFIASLFRNNKAVFNEAKKTVIEKKMRLPGFKEYMVKHLEPSLSAIGADYAEHILACIILENSRKDASLAGLPELWRDFTYSEVRAIFH